MSSEFRPFFESINAKAAPSPSTGFAPVSAASSAAAPQNHSAKCTEPKVELKREGDRVVEIRVYCRCGEVIELGCEY